MQKENINKISWWGGFGLILIIIGLVWWFDYIKTDDYSSCVDSCVSDVDFCVDSTIIYDKNFNEYILLGNYENCFSELELCILDCES